MRILLLLFFIDTSIAIMVSLFFVHVPALPTIQNLVNSSLEVEVI